MHMPTSDVSGDRDGDQEHDDHELSRSIGCRFLLARHAFDEHSRASRSSVIHDLRGEHPMNGQSVVVITRERGRKHMNTAAAATTPQIVPLCSNPGSTTNRVTATTKRPMDVANDRTWSMRASIPVARRGLHVTRPDRSPLPGTPADSGG